MKYIKKVSASYQGDTPIATSISSSSTNDEVAGAKAVYDYGQTLGKQNYSTTEQVVGTWIDGKPLYEKTITNISAPVVATDGTAVARYINIADNIDFAFIVFHAGIDQFGQIQPLPYVNNAGRQLKAFISVTTNIKQYNLTSTGTAYNQYTAFAVIRYTKTTDTATTNSLNTASLMNTGSLVGMGDRAELTSLANELTDKDVGNIEQVEEVKEQVENISGEKQEE